MTRMTATEVARNFSMVMNRVDAGEEIEIVRNGAPVAELRRPSRSRTITAAALRELVAGLPAVDGDFARDVEQERRSLGTPEPAWPS